MQHLIFHIVLAGSMGAGRKVVLGKFPCDLPLLAQIPVEPGMLLPARRDHTVEGVYPQQTATQGKGVVNHRAGNIEEVDQHLIGLFMVAPGNDDRKNPAVAANGQLPVVKPGNPFGITILIGHVAIKQHHMRPQLAHHAVGILTSFAVIAGISTGDDAEPKTGIIRGSPERHRAAGAV